MFAFGEKNRKEDHEATKANTVGLFHFAAPRQISGSNASSSGTNSHWGPTPEKNPVANATAPAFIPIANGATTNSLAMTLAVFRQWLSEEGLSSRKGSENSGLRERAN